MKPSEPALETPGTCFQLVYHYFGRWILSTHTGNVKKYVRLVKTQFVKVLLIIMCIIR